MPFSTHIVAVAATLLPLLVGAQQSVWGQCGGTGWSGATTCASGSACVKLNDYYYQCQPGAATTTTPKTTAAPTTSKPTSSACTTTYTLTGPRMSSTSTPSPTSTGTAPSSGSGPGTTLQSGYQWIRAVEAPNFHKYLQSANLNAVGTATLDSATTAGQFAIVSGQLVELISPSSTSPTLLYANVGQPATPSSTLLPVTFSTAKNTFGTFSFSGDALQWSDPSIKRPNLSAWYVCTGQQVFINTGQYLYGTPTGCADETIHYYGNSVADV